MERDLEALYLSYRNFGGGGGGGGLSEDPMQFVLCTPLGLVKPRAGGLPMRLTYFMTPSEMLQLEKTCSDLTCDDFSTIEEGWYCKCRLGHGRVPLPGTTDQMS